jgi:hypothetical protein
MPPTLTDLNVCLDRLPPLSRFSKFPNLLKLKVLLYFCHENTYLVKDLPPRIFDLCIRMSWQMTAHGMFDFSGSTLSLLSLTLAVHKVDKKFTATLPKTLTFLRLNGYKCRKYVSLRRLPPLLKSLELPDVQLGDGAIKHIPSSHLTHLNLSKSNCSPACISSLPRRLESLDMRSTQKMNVSIFEHLPRSITRLFIDESDFGDYEENRKYIPDTIRTWKLRFKDEHKYKSQRNGRSMLSTTRS